MNGFKECVE
jgi:hypothetical protein